MSAPLVAGIRTEGQTLRPIALEDVAPFATLLASERLVSFHGRIVEQHALEV